MIWYCVYYQRSRISNATLSLCSFYSFHIRMEWINMKNHLIICARQKLIIIQSIFKSAYRFGWQLHRIKSAFNWNWQKVQQSNRPTHRGTSQMLVDDAFAIKNAFNWIAKVTVACGVRMAQECFWLHFIHINYPGRDLRFGFVFAMNYSDLLVSDILHEYKTWFGDLFEVICLGKDVLLHKKHPFALTLANASSERFKCIRLVEHKSNYFWVENCAVLMLMHWKLRKDFADLIDDTFNGRSQFARTSTQLKWSPWNLCQRNHYYGQRAVTPPILTQHLCTALTLSTTAQKC